ncbi:MAG: MoaD/ThiS family protein [Pseudomonadota bacterium]|nr:MoaD/ThiS family protein [Pseudomonadota bacterium]
MKVEVRYFAALREALGAGATVEVADGTTVGELRTLLVATDARHVDALGSGRLLRAARNRRLCADDEVVDPGDEVAFFPPVTGG